MVYFYHGVPDELEGSELVPLTVMQRRRPDLYQKYASKYAGREEVMARRIPLLNCAWNEVVQLLPLHPRQLFELQKELGLIAEIPHYRYFQITPDDLDPNMAAVYFKTAAGDEHITVKWLKDIDLADLQTIPPATVQYYKAMAAQGEQVFNYQFVPHILYKGSIDISRAEIVDIGE